MAFNIVEFKNSLTSDVMRASHYEVRITPPQSMASSDSRELSFRCMASSLPGKGVTTVERQTNGVLRKIAYGIVNQEHQVTFIASGSMNEREYFHKWQSIVYNPKTGEPNYYQNYIGSVEIVTFDTNGNKNYSISLIEAYPIHVSDIILSWEGQNQIATFTVDFAYRYWDRNELINRRIT